MIRMHERIGKTEITMTVSFYSIRNKQNSISDLLIQGYTQHLHALSKFLYHSLITPVVITTGKGVRIITFYIMIMVQDVKLHLFNTC